MRVVAAVTAAAGATVSGTRCVKAALQSVQTGPVPEAKPAKPFLLVTVRAEYRRCCHLSNWIVPVT
jgi:hypothetical protein